MKRCRLSALGRGYGGSIGYERAKSGRRPCVTTCMQCVSFSVGLRSGQAPKQLAYLGSWLAVAADYGTKAKHKEFKPSIKDELAYLKAQDVVERDAKSFSRTGIHARVLIDELHRAQF